MVSAIGSPPTSGAAYTPGASTAGIEAQIIRYKKELADCVNCESAKTTEGKAAIAAAASKVSIAEAQIESLSTSSPGNASGASDTNPAHVPPAKAYEDALIYENTAAYEPGAALKRSDASTGSLVDLFA